MSFAEYTAFREYLTSGPNLDQVHDAALVNQKGELVRTSYFILFGGLPELLDDDRLSLEQLLDADAEYTYTLRAIAATATGAVALAAGAGNHLIGHVLDVPGRSCSAIARTRVYETEADDAVRPPLIFIDAEYSFRSNRI